MDGRKRILMCAAAFYIAASTGSPVLAPHCQAAEQPLSAQAVSAQSAGQEESIVGEDAGNVLGKARLYKQQSFRSEKGSVDTILEEFAANYPQFFERDMTENAEYEMAESDGAEPESEDAEIAGENNQSGLTKQEILDFIRNIDYVGPVYEIDTATYDESMDALYKEAFDLALHNQLPVVYERTEALYLRDVMSFSSDDWTEERYFEEYVKDGDYYYFDFDGDGLPELIVDAVWGFSGPCVLQYDASSGLVRLYNNDSGTSNCMYYALLGAGRFYYCAGYGSGDYWGYVPLNEEGGVNAEAIVGFDLLFDNGKKSYQVWLGNGEPLKLSREEWEEVSEKFFEAIRECPEPMTYEDIFGNGEDVEKGNGNQEGRDGLPQEDVSRTLAVYDALLHQVKGGSYLILDSDGDGNPELHLKRIDEYYDYYYILKFQKEHLFVWKSYLGNKPSDRDNAERWTPLKDGSMLYSNGYRMDGRVWDVYDFVRLTPSAREHRIVSFRYGDSQKAGNPGEMDDFADDYEYQGPFSPSDDPYGAEYQSCSRDTWLSMLSDYIGRHGMEYPQLEEATRWGCGTKNLRLQEAAQWRRQKHVQLLP